MKNKKTEEKYKKGRETLSNQIQNINYFG